MLELIKDFLNNKFQRVLLNSLASDLLPIKAGVHQRSISGPLFFLIYINGLPDNLISSVKLFEDDASLFSTIDDTYASGDALSGDLDKTAEWTFQQNMHFNLILNKQAQEISF